MSKETPSAEQVLERWALPPEFDEAGKNQMRAKAAAVPAELHAFGTMSDEWVADRVRMLMRQDIWHEAICCAARDRIMRLSLEVAGLRDAFGPDAAGREFAELLEIAAQVLNDRGGGPLEDCLRLKAQQIREALS